MAAGILLRNADGPAHRPLDHRDRPGTRHAGRRDRGRPHHRGVARRPPGLPSRDVRGGLRAVARRLTRPSGVHDRERRHLPRGPAAPARLRLLRAGAGSLRARPRRRDRGARGPPDERPAGRAFGIAIAAGSPRAWQPTWSSSIRRRSGRATWDEPKLPATGIDRVVVNGRTVVDAGQPTPSRPGIVVRGTGRG